MIYLILTIICAAVLILLFKVFERRDIPVFQAIVFNYWAAAICGFIFLPDKAQVFNHELFRQNWFYFSLLLGSMFIGTFTLTSQTTVHFGVSTASVASKLGLVFPVLAAFIFYDESVNVMKIAGIVFALVAVVLASWKQEDEHTHKQFTVAQKFLPYIVFICSGACDGFTQFANKKLITGDTNSAFSLFLFIAAALVGSMVFAYQLATKKAKFNVNCLIGGAVLGTFNYLAYIFMLKALSTLNSGSSVIFPLSNLGTVAFASIVALIAFKEKLSRINMVGMGFAAVAIILIVLSS